MFMTSLSKSALWIKMQEYYHNIGPEAWQDEVVPLQISSNKNLAAAYANVIVAQILDWRASHPNTDSPEPFYIIEVGTGHGKLSFYLLKCMQELLQNFNMPPSTVKLVMTDIAIKNVASWRDHPSFNEWFANGCLDVAEFNAMCDTEIKLQFSGTTLKHGSLSKPVFMLCNYLFDSLSHDAFQVRDHKLYEVQIKINSDADWQEYFAQAKFDFTYNPISTDYYEDAALNKILADYEQRLPNATFTIPIGGIDCINTVKKFSKHHMVLLLADKGHANTELFDDDSEPDISVHGSISLMVNFDALRQYFELNAGTAMLMNNCAAEFQVACLVTKHAMGLPFTKHAFQQSFTGACPQDLISLCYIDDDINTDFKNLDQMLAILNLTLWDPNIVCDMHDTLTDLIEDAELTVEQDLIIMRGVKIAWEYFFKLEKTQDLPFAIGSIYYAIDEYELALKFFLLSIQEFGENAENLYNIAIAYQALDQDSTAKEYAQRTLALDSKYTSARELLEELN
jgi:hypothetical protein